MSSLLERSLGIVVQEVSVLKKTRFADHSRSQSAVRKLYDLNFRTVAAGPVLTLVAKETCENRFSETTTENEALTANPGQLANGSAPFGARV
jgi:hypothetical protein